MVRVMIIGGDHGDYNDDDDGKPMVGDLLMVLTGPH